jgi:hypothetical protein
MRGERQGERRLHNRRLRERALALRRRTIPLILAKRLAREGQGGRPISLSLIEPHLAHGKRQHELDSFLHEGSLGSTPRGEECTRKLCSQIVMDDRRRIPSPMSSQRVCFDYRLSLLIPSGSLTSWSRCGPDFSLWPMPARPETIPHKSSDAAQARLGW